MARIIAAVACLTALLALASAEDMMKMKVPVTVYYESLCPDSMKFFHEQLHPTWMNLSMYLDLTLVPFGRATYNMTADGNYTFECKHGERECEGDRVHICAIQKTPQSDYMKLINCAMDMSRDAKNNSAPYSGLGKQCADSVGMTGYAQTIEKCVMEESDKLFAEMGNKTWELNPKLESVPAIVFKNEYKPSEQSKYRSDFKMAVCSMIMGDKPDVCKTPAKASAGNLVPEMAVSVSLAVISTILSRM